MGHAGIGSGDNDGIKGQPLSTVLIHLVNQLRLGLQFGHTGMDSGQGIFEGLVGDFLCLAQQVQLPVLFHIPEAIDLGIEGRQLGIQVLFQTHKFGHSQIIFLIAQSGDAKVRNGLIEALGIIPAGIHIQDLKALDVCLGGLNIAAVGEITAALLRYDCHTLGNVEFRAVMAAVARGQQQTVDLAIQQRQELFQIFHVFILLFLAAKTQGSSRTWRAFSQKV